MTCKSSAFYYSYKRYFALTAINVHSTFLYGTYSDSVEEMFVETLKNRDMTIEQYEKVTRDYYNKIVELQQSNAVGGFGGDKSYDFLKSTIDNTVLSGIDIRKKLNPRFSKEFYDESGKLRPRIVVEIPYEQQEASALGIILFLLMVSLLVLKSFLRIKKSFYMISFWES